MAYSVRHPENTPIESEKLHGRIRRMYTPMENGYGWPSGVAVWETVTTSIVRTSSFCQMSSECSGRPAYSSTVWIQHTTTLAMFLLEAKRLELELSLELELQRD